MTRPGSIVFFPHEVGYRSCVFTPAPTFIVYQPLDEDMVPFIIRADYIGEYIMTFSERYIVGEAL